MSLLHEDSILVSKTAEILDFEIRVVEGLLSSVSKFCSSEQKRSNGGRGDGEPELLGSRDRRPPRSLRRQGPRKECEAVHMGLTSQSSPRRRLPRLFGCHALRPS